MYGFAKNVFETQISHFLFNKRNPLKVEIYREGDLVHVENIFNDICDAGKNSLLDVYFRNQTQIAAWYFGLIDNASFSALAVGDTMSSHSGWIENTAYAESTRQQWSPAAASGKSISNTTVATFSINASGNLKGIFVTSNSTKSSTSGTLWSTAPFGSVVPVANGDQLKVTYTVNA